MSTTKKRHIQESNLILEGRHVLNESLNPVPPDLINDVLIISKIQDPKNASKYDEALKNNLPDKLKGKIWPDKKTRELVGSAFRNADTWCTNLAHSNKDFNPKEYNLKTGTKFCIEVKDHSGEYTTWLSGYFDYFGKTY